MDPHRCGRLATIPCWVLKVVRAVISICVGGYHHANAIYSVKHEASIGSDAQIAAGIEGTYHHTVGNWSPVENVSLTLHIVPVEVSRMICMVNGAARRSLFAAGAEFWMEALATEASAPTSFANKHMLYICDSIVVTTVRAPNSSGLIRRKLPRHLQYVLHAICRYFKQSNAHLYSLCATAVS
jgi:hypothetical protein